MRSYIVGGAVRDRLLGRRGGDVDHVVVGATPEQMLAAGFRPVGRDFPVFLHPRTGEEYALARTERKVARGYRGFEFHADPSVTLEQDLARRDLTINAMALDPDSGEIVDPFGGRRDLALRVLRHVSDAFAEDPVRILRVARFAARFHDFTLAPETLALMRQLVAAGEVDALVPERVWQELSRGLMEAHPARLFEVLRDCGALAALLPEVDRLWGARPPAEHSPGRDCGAHLLRALDTAARLDAPLPVRWACVGRDLGSGTTPPEERADPVGHEMRSVQLVEAIDRRLKVPADCHELAVLAAREHAHVHASGALGADALLRLLERCDALRRPARFEQLLLACECDARARAGFEHQPYPPRERLRRVLTLARGIDTAAVAAAVTAASGTRPGPAVGAAIRRARVQALAAAGY